MSIVLIRAAILYSLVIISIRLMGKRQMGELQPSELVVTILISNIATLPIEDTSIPMAAGVIPIFTLVCLDVLMSAATLKFRKLRLVVSGSPKIIIRDGVIDQQQLKVLRFSIDDLLESLHAYNIFDISEVQFAVVETTGKISVYQKFPNQTVTADMLELKGASENPPVILVDDGVVIEDAFASVDLGRGWLESILAQKKLTVKDVFLFTASTGGKYNIILKEV